MKIEAIRVYQVDLPLIEGRYTWAGGKHYVETFDSTIVEIVSDDGRKGDHANDHITARAGQLLTRDNACAVQQEQQDWLSAWEETSHPQQ